MDALRSTPEALVVRIVTCLRQTLRRPRSQVTALHEVARVLCNGPPCFAVLKSHWVSGHARRTSDTVPHATWPLATFRPVDHCSKPRQNMRNGTCCRLTRSDILPESWFLRVHFLYLPRQTHARVVGVRSALLSKSTVDRPCRLYCML